jgi:hypothetical protein
MLATPERVRGDGQAPDQIVWHKPVGRCNGECDFHAIACSDTEGIVFPAPKQEVPLRLDKPGERWCPDCLAIIRS